ncbi:hypothetical protein SERLA73DRAFT_191156 [Serpula lacrymans var. lacrymans S7.3]|uniref:DNA polymerase epsilon subunit D n=2 Tax=Serpula lacrymans var. lacrymans TaxID=341189 RepID=F8QGZ7_SERL3|nr:uncharacterized protein SERLADRAFT_481099 [Serpula lacrymans var. lacrymans S7.9]EGN92398.1 hypothetical protein SERLA73DRAFT_191156 [Serpula lacrymans var. lacrymans S7.3]EGO18434.1 hypothetical protein SERLADRAFT_481099 [Serpula lacrymans var. lacrymans S7.9]
MPRKDATSGPISAQAQQDLVSEGIENFELPKSLVTKIAKSSIPENSKLQKDTVLSLVKGSTVFINYLAATAHDVAQSKQHKSISASDVLKALEIIEFGDLVDNLQAELQVYRDNVKGDKGKKSGATSSSASKGKAKETESISSTSRSKGKERAVPLPPPFTSVPRATALSSISQGDTNGADDDLMEEDDEEEDDDELADIGAEEDDEGVEEDEIIDEDDEEGEGEEEPVDLMAVENSELREDSMVLDLPDDAEE